MREPIPSTPKRSKMQIKVGDNVKLKKRVLDTLPYPAKASLISALIVLEVNGDTVGAFLSSDRRNGIHRHKDDFEKV